MGRFELGGRLRFSVDEDGTSTTGTLSGSANRLRLEVSDPGRLLAGLPVEGPGADAAEVAARAGVVVEVVGPAGTVAQIGAVRSRVLDRVLTRSRFVRVGGLRAAWGARRAARRHRRSGRTTLLPPGTPVPVLPRTGPRRVRTTHDPGRGGNARLYLYSEYSYEDVERPEYPLGPVRTTIGSAPDSDVRLEGLAPTHVVVQHTRADEYVAVSTGPSGSLRANGVPVRYAMLRTGTSLQVGAHRLNYVRDEHADHGRPYGGRSGGELGRQRRQPPRPNP